MKQHPHYPQHCTCETDPLECGCGCRRCALKKAGAREAQLEQELNLLTDPEMQASVDRNPAVSEWFLDDMRETTMKYQRRGDFEDLGQRARTLVWARAIGAPAYARWERSDN